MRHAAQFVIGFIALAIVGTLGFLLYRNTQDQQRLQKQILELRRGTQQTQKGIFEQQDSLDLIAAAHAKEIAAAASLQRDTAAKLARALEELRYARQTHEVLIKQKQQTEELLMASEKKIERLTAQLEPVRQELQSQSTARTSAEKLLAIANADIAKLNQALAASEAKVRELTAFMAQFPPLPPPENTPKQR